MKIAIDISLLRKSANQFRGLGTYCRNLIQELLIQDKKNEYLFITKSDSDCAYLEEWVYSLNKYASNFHLQKIGKNGITELKFQLLLYRLLRQEKIDVFHLPVQIGLPWFRNHKTIVTIHDLVQCRFPHDYLSGRGIKYNLSFYVKLLATSTAHRFIAISESTKKDIIKYLKVPENRIKVIYNGVSSDFKPWSVHPLKEEIKIKFKISSKFIMYVGGIEERKNILRMFQAFNIASKALKENISLLVVGKIDKDGEMLLSNIPKECLRNIIFIGSVTQEELIGLYNMCEFLLFPSIYEGFGLPAVEALACGKTIVASNASSLPEIVGDAALCVDPYSVVEIARGISDLLVNNKLRSELEHKAAARAKMFNWRSAAIQTLSLYEEVI